MVHSSTNNNKTKLVKIVKCNFFCGLLLREIWVTKEILLRALRTSYFTAGATRRLLSSGSSTQINFYSSFVLIFPVFLEFKLVFVTAFGTEFMPLEASGLKLGACQVCPAFFA